MLELVDDERGAGRVRLAELLGALSYALDLTEGQPIGHCVRSAWIALRIGRAIGLPEMPLRDVYYTAMLKDLGCSSNAARICELYLADDIGFKRDFKTAGSSLPQVLGFVLSHTGRGSPLAERLRAILSIVRDGPEIARTLIETRCHRGAEIAARLRFPVNVCDGILSLDEMWDGSGKPEGKAGHAIPLTSRIALLAQVIDVFHAAAGPGAVRDEIEARTGTWFDPSLVEAFLGIADSEFWTSLADPDLPDLVFDMEPARGTVVPDDDYLDDIAEAFAGIVDSKSPFTSGHSERVAAYSVLIATEMGYDPARRRWLRRAALLHDIGKLGVSNSILDKNGKLDDEEWLSMRRHATESRTILERVPIFAEMARIGGAHHERLDGKGYPLGIGAVDISLDTRIVTVADVFDALTADRPYRTAMPVDKALSIMRDDVGLAFDPECFVALELAIETANLRLKLAA